MADTAVAITAGAGTNIDTRTESTNSNHRQVVVIGDPAVNAGVAPVDVTNGLSVNVTNASLPVATHAVTQSGTWTVQPGNTANTTAWLAKISDGTNAAAIKAASTAPVATDPALVVAISPNSVNANGQATMANSAPVVLASNQSSIPVAATLNAETTKVIGVVQGAAASGATASGNPLPAAGLAVSSETVVTNGQAAALVTDLARKLIVLPYANPENFVSGAITTAMTGTTSTSLVAAPAAGLRNYITTIIVSNSHATVGTDIIIQDGSGGTTLLTIPAAALYGGATITLPMPLRQPTTATALFCANVTTGASTKVSAVGYKGA